MFYFLNGTFINTPKDHVDDASIVYYVLTISLSVSILFIAYIKASQAIKNSRTSYLLRIDERWSSKEIIEAREVIHEIYLKVKQNNPENTCEKHIKECIGESIYAISKYQSRISCFIRLLNFLDFLETIGYLYYIKAVSIKEINELLGNSVIYFFEIYMKYIKCRRDKCDDDKFYEHFEFLYNDIKIYINKIKYWNNFKEKYIPCYRKK